jgi:hypothetical protein
MKIKLTFLMLFAMLAFTACKVTLVPGRSDAAIQQVQDAATATDNLYDNIIANSDKSYNASADNYKEVKEQIMQILVLDSARKNTKVILIIANDISKRFAKYENEHKQNGTINNSQARTYQDYMHALFSSLLNAENSFK